VSRWLYLLASLPVISDLIETGVLPARPRSWITEVTIGVVIAALVHHVRQTHSQLLALTLTDPLTGLGNRRAFIEVVAADCARRRRPSQPLTLVCIDLDNFKQVNDQAGHPAGDRVLQQLGAAIQDTLRAGTDHGFRLGGDEFAMLLPGSSTAAARTVLERVRLHCAAADPLWVESFLKISAGIVEFHPQESAFDFYHRADTAMYESKNLRNQPAVIRDGAKSRFTVMD
jgi:diguanylate cyclase (GGDEF)-like protein